MPHKKKALVAASFLAAAGSAHSGQWSGELGMGYIATAGNSGISSLSSKAGFVYGADPWKNTLTSATMHASDPEGSTAERYTANDKLDYHFTPAQYTFLLGEYEKDLFGPVRERFSETLGYGRHLLPGPVHTLDAELGAGARQMRENVTGLRHEEAVVRFNGRYLWDWRDHNGFAQAVKVESGRENTLTESTTELKFALVGNVSAVGSYHVRHNSHAPAGTGSTDAITSASLTYTFGRQKP
ncbi:MAG TPA: DUF481 domain-containing protein [Candidatus Binatia bacterium]|nr:DUF481 domain-containing protein [Candidatus Binatia bacterium]